MVEGLKMEVSFSKVVKSRRLEKQLKLIEVAKEAGIAASYLYRLEEGGIKYPSVQVISRLAHALNIELLVLINFLLSEEDRINEHVY